MVCVGGIHFKGGRPPQPEPAVCSRSAVWLPARLVPGAAPARWPASHAGGPPCCPPPGHRFNEVFQRDEHGMPRTWQPSVDIAAVTASGRRAAALLLSQLCFVRTGPTSPETAAAEAAVLRLADDAAAGPGPGSSGAGGGSLRSRGAAAEVSAFDLLSAAEWPGVAEGDVLLAPGQARSIWRQFMSDSTFSVQQVGGPSCCWCQGHMTAGRSVWPGPLTAHCPTRCSRCRPPPAAPRLPPRLLCIPCRTGSSRAGRHVSTVAVLTPLPV